MELLIFLATIGGIGYWIYLAAFHKGKHEGSKRAYGIGREHQRYGRGLKKPF